ncbi:MAG TPA: hypothetical protein VGO49_07550 [Bradyrhizobium sp.]|nr:hypothetical protein [Bradyrhizobium sp.]
MSIDALRPDGRIISHAIAAGNPAYPNKLSITLIATMLSLVLTAAYITTTDLLRMTAPRVAVNAEVGDPGAEIQH